MPKKAIVRKTSKISFQNEFYSDLSINDMLYAVTLRSPVEKGIITSINHGALPEDYFLITARDVPGVNLIDTPGGKIPIFCEGNISYLGEPVALLVGKEEKILEKLKNEINITIDEHPIESYLDDIEGNELFSNTLAERTVTYGTCFKPKKDKTNEQLIDEYFENNEDNLVIEKNWTYSQNNTTYSEPNGALCVWKNETLSVFTPTQWLSNLRTILSTALKFEEENINIEKTISHNRGSNSVWYNSVIASQVAVASLKIGKPVKLIYSRDEQNNFLDTMHPVKITNKTMIEKNGKIKAMKILIDVDAGFCNPIAQEIVDRLTIASSGCYYVENLYVKAKANKSSQPASNIDLQMIDTASFFAIENQMNELCSLCNLTPLEIRILNSLNLNKKKKASDFIFVNEFKYYNEMLNAISKISDFNRKYASYHLNKIHRAKMYGKEFYEKTNTVPLRGIGLAFAYEGSGYYGSNVYTTDPSLEVTMNVDETVEIHCPPVSYSIQAIWEKIASDILKINPGNIKINSVFKSDEEPALPENVYSNISVMTSLLKKCCDSINTKKVKEKLPITIKRKISPALKKEWNKESFCGKPFHAVSTACAIVETEFNSTIYKEEIRNIYIVVNGGKILNQNSAKARIKLGIQNVLNSIVSEDQISTPNISINFLQSEETPAQIGELMYNTIPSAFTQALSQSINADVDLIPLKYDSIYKNLRNKKMQIQKMEKQEKENQNADSTDLK